MPPRKSSGRKKPKKPAQSEDAAEDGRPEVSAEAKASAAEHKKKGNSAFIAQKFEEAVNHFTMAILDDPNDHVFYSNRSACFASLGQWERASEDGAKCVDLKPEWPKGYVRLGLALAELGDLGGAVKAYTQGLEHDMDNLSLKETLEETRAQHKAQVTAAVQGAKGGQDSSTNGKAEGAAPEPEAYSPVIGIDLGTTFSCVAVWRNGQAEVLPNEEGELTTPSWVAFLEDGERVIGDPAKRQASQNAKNTLFNIKRIIGREFGECAEDIKRMPFEVKDCDGKPMVEVDVGQQRKRFAPEQISAMVLEKMKRSAEAALGCKVSKAVVTVPAYFNDAQRRLTKDAGTIAGLDVLRIINEPTAAALAYGLDRPKGQDGQQDSANKVILVFDLGGGTFDTTMLRLQEGVFEVLATAGDTHLGGEDFDSLVADWAQGEVKKKLGKDLFKGNNKALRKLRAACESAKRQLSGAERANIEVFVGEEEIQLELTRDKFVALNESTFKRCLEAVKRCLADAKVKKEEVDDIVLVGGSTRVPRIQALLSDFFDGKALCKSVHPDQAVAYGAAVQGAILGGVRDPATQALLLVDVIPLSLGVECEGRHFSRVVARNSSLPCRKTSDFTTVEDWQTEVDIRVFEGECPSTDGNHLLGEFTITGVQRARKGEPKIDVTFEINTNGLLQVSAVDTITGSSADVKIQHDRGRLSTEEVDKMVAEAERMREADEARLREMEAQ